MSIKGQAPDHRLLKANGITSLGRPRVKKVNLMTRAAGPLLVAALATLSACAAGSYEAPQLDPVSGRTSAS